MAGDVISATEHNLNKFYACDTQEKAEAFLDTLPDTERRNTVMCADSAKISWLVARGCAEVLLPLYGKSTLVTTQEQVNKIYDSLFYLIKSAQDAAKDEADSPLRIILGENHIDRNGLLVSAMVLHIAKRLGIGKLGIEVSEKSFKAGDGRTVPGLEDMRHLAREWIASGKIKDEIDSSHIGGKSKNFWYQTLLSEELGISQFASDPLYANDFQTERTKDNSFEHREMEMVKVLDRYNEDLVSIYGYGHVKGLQQKLGEKALFIDTTHMGALFVDGEHSFPPNENLADTVSLPANTATAARLGTEYKTTGTIHVQVKGKGVETVKEALKMAEAADLARGEICIAQQGSWQGKAKLPPGPLKRG